MASELMTRGVTVSPQRMNFFTERLCFLAENFDLGQDKLSKRVFLDKYFVEKTFITIQSWSLLLGSLIEIFLQDVKFVP